MTALSEDRFLDARVVANQPLDGFRSGLDAVMLAAAILARSGETLLELGAGTGVASLCVAARLPACTIVGVERVSSLVELANQNAKTNGVADRVRFEPGQVQELPAQCRIEFDHVFCNPPFHSHEGKASPREERAMALQDLGQLDVWLAVGLGRVRSGGTFTAILRADRLAEALTALPAGGLTIFPMWPRNDRPAKRVIVQVRKNSRAPLVLRRGLVLHEGDGRYTTEADEILRAAGSLALAG